MHNCGSPRRVVQAGVSDTNRFHSPHSTIRAPESPRPGEVRREERRWDPRAGPGASPNVPVP